jgi:glycosyltransferase involved in cell wall biosynthesis
LSGTSPFVLVSGGFVETGGMDRANHALASYLARQGHPVHLVTHRAAPNLSRMKEVRVHAVPRPAGSYFLGQPLLDHIGKSWAAWARAHKGRIVVNGGNCRVGDVNWVHYVHAAFSPVPSGSTIHRCWRRLQHRMYLQTERQALRQARLILADSQTTRLTLLSRLKLDPARVHTVYYGTDPRSFYPIGPEERTATRCRLGWPLDRPQVAFLGAVSDPRKGFDTLFNCWKRLCANPSWDADLIVMGAGGNELFAWRQRTTGAGMGDRIRYIGFRSDVPELLRACDALVSPTRYEPYGLGVQEALCCGLPALVSACAGVAERYPLDLQELLLPDPTDVEDLCARLLAWRADASCWKERLQGLTRQLHSWTWDAMAAQILDLIHRSG